MLAAGGCGGYRSRMTARQSSGGRPPRGKDSRIERQAALLRANLKRRKQQARRRADGAKPNDASPAPGAARDKQGN